MLHAHNEQRQSQRPPYPGTQFAALEQARLVQTAALQDMTVEHVLQRLQQSPYVEKDEDVYTAAQGALWLGWTGLTVYLNDWPTAVAELQQSGDDNADNAYGDYVRFLTHLVLYLDALTVESPLLPAHTVATWKHGIVTRYLDYLSHHEHMIPFWVLYASFLPTADVLQWMPRRLMAVTGLPLRQLVLRQMTQFLEPPGTDRAILLALARDTLEEMDLSDDKAVVSPLDVQKIRTTEWFALRPDLRPDGVHFANQVLRQFLLADKVVAATQLVRHELSRELLAYAVQEDAEPSSSLAVMDPATQEDNDALMELENGRVTDDKHTVVECRREFVALVAHLDATAAFDQWKRVLAQVSVVTPPPNNDTLDASGFNDVERQVAVLQERRQWAERKRISTQKITVAADEALRGLEGVLKFDGGWLLSEDDDQNDGDTVVARDASAAQELSQLRAKVIPATILRYRQVCMDTAQWMDGSLYDAIQCSDKDNIADVLSKLDPSNVPETSALAPSYWTKQALVLIDTITSETYNSLPVLSKEKRQTILSFMGETMVAHLKYSSDLV